MKLEEIERKNERFRMAAGRIDELLPDQNLVSLSSLMIRSSRKIDRLLPAVLTTGSRVQFYKTLDRLEDELDEIVFALDQLAIVNTDLGLPQLEEFIKFGYDLLQLYSLACDSIIERKTKVEVE